MKKVFGLGIVIVLTLAVVLAGQVGALANKAQYSPSSASVPSEAQLNVRPQGTVDGGTLFVTGFGEDDSQDELLIVNQVSDQEEFDKMVAIAGELPEGYVDGSAVTIGYSKEGETIPVDVVVKYNLGPNPTAKLYYWIGEKDGKTDVWNPDEWAELEVTYDKDGLAVAIIPAGAPNPTFVIVID